MLANLARVWRDNSTNLRDFYITAGHIAAFLAVWGITVLARRIERRQVSQANRRSIWLAYNPV